jgi:hypothetical protein
VDEALAVLREYLAMPQAQSPEGAAAVARPMPTRAEQAVPAGSAAVETRAVPTTTGLQLGLGAYQGGTGNSDVAGHTKQMIIAGEYDTGPNAGSSVKLLISDYDNDTSGGADIYPIYVEDENNNVDFYVRKQAGVVSSAYFGGDLIVEDTLDIGYQIVAGEVGEEVANCPIGWKVLGGGCSSPAALEISRPLDGTPSAWACHSPGAADGIFAYAICADIK